VQPQPSRTEIAGGQMSQALVPIEQSQPRLLGAPSKKKVLASAVMITQQNH